MIRKLTSRNLFRFAIGIKPSDLNSMLIPPNQSDLISPDHNLPTEISMEYSRKLVHSEIEARIYSVAAKFSPLDIKSFAMNKHFKELKLDSLEAIAFVCAIEDEFNCVFEETVFDNFQTSDEISRYLARDRYSF